MNKIETKQVLEMHRMLIKQIGGREGIKDYNLLESALNSPFQTFFGQELYPLIEQKAARLCYGLIKNHAFYDGNKRIGMLTLLTFLEINDIKVKFTDKEIINIGISVASGKMNFEDIIDNINQHKQVPEKEVE